MGAASELANVADLEMEIGRLDGAREHLMRALAVPGIIDDRYLGPRSQRRP